MSESKIPPKLLPVDCKDLDSQGLRRARLWLGTWSLGGEGWGGTDTQEGLEMLELAFADGIRHFDTAAFYAHGRSDALLARFLKRKPRKFVFISSKGGLRWEGRKVVHDASPATLRNTLTETLRAFGTDYLDLFQLHWPDPATPVSESLQALKDFEREGLIRSWGIGNFSPAAVSQLIPAGLQVPHQFRFNLIQRDTATIAAGLAEQRCLNCVYSPLEQGLLARPPGVLASLGNADLRRRNPAFSDHIIAGWLKLYDQSCNRARIPRAEAALAWVLGQNAIDAVIVGPRTRQQWQTIRSADPERLRLQTPELWSFLSARGQS